MTTQSAHIAARALPKMSTVQFQRRKCAIDLAYEHAFDNKPVKDRLFGWLWAHHPNSYTKVSSIKHNMPSNNRSAKRGNLPAVGHRPGPSYTHILKVTRGFHVPNGTRDCPITTDEDYDEAFTINDESKLAPFQYPLLSLSQYQMSGHDRKHSIVAPNRMDWPQLGQPPKQELPSSAPDRQNMGTHLEEQAASEMRKWTFAMLCEARKAEMKNLSKASRLDIKRILSMTPLYS